MNVAMLKAGAVGLLCFDERFAAGFRRPRGAVSCGTWTLVAADVLHADGTRGRDYGAAPKGLLLNDAQGHYSAEPSRRARSS